MKIRIIQTVIELEFDDENDVPTPKAPSPPSLIELLCRQAERALHPNPPEKTVYGPFLSQ